MIRRSVFGLAGRAIVALALSAPSPAHADEESPEGARAEPHAPGADDRSVANLLLDLRKIVELQESAGWKIDRYEFESMMPSALMSVCAASVPLREGALVASHAEVLRLGGPVESAVAARRGSVEGLDDLLFASRVEGLLERAIGRAPDECPPWVRGASRFDALQSPVDRWLLVVEGGGQGTIQFELDRPDGTSGATLGGGGGGRVLAGYAFGDRWSLRFGPDVSAKALVKRSGETTTLPLQLQFGVPVVLRRTSISWFSSLELAPLALVVEDDSRVRAGVRAGALIGRSALRVRSIVPWAGLGIELEAFPSPDERPTLLNVKGGLRAGIDWLL